MLDTITDLAREKSSDKRRELLGRVADMFFDGAELHTDHEAILFRDIVLKMLNDVGAEGRAIFSERASKEPTLPIEIARNLAQDDVEIAAPVLKNSPVLTDEDFVALSQTLSPAHLETIAERESLSGTVTDALIENGTRAVWHKVTQNQSAEITDKGFDTLVDNATDDEILQTSLSSRKDIPEHAAKKLLPLLPPEGKARLAKLFRHDPHAAGDLVAGAQKKFIEHSLSERSERIEAKVLISQVKQGTRALSDAVSLLAEAQRGSDIIMLLAAIIGLDQAIISNVFYQSNDEPIAILCKSMDLETNAFAKLMNVRQEKLGLSLSAVGRSIAHFKELDVASSQRAMRFVQMRNNVAKTQ
ncbi:hypothetical protein SAMN04515647_0288 [Cohaesibacter sp. ES.047]|uniref:DUF2336 domain-containing protein n=1 Tax=Cohaesibacter sp. ES.047 TaxID=1798205 RepID=UPI000BB86E71|nr:DUF2336 domain-containing protein [Cohaesibacter sp. ES.047]SNY90142.1 hypothetical protein SAMN04515647_0288 [Cohaesibacter sp. ES.047]